MPVRLTLTLVPEHPQARPPRHTGPAVQAAFLAALADHDPPLATELHDMPKYKPFTLSPLFTSTNEPNTGGTGIIHIGLLVDELTAPVLTALSEREHYRIGTTGYRTSTVAVTSSATYSTLALDAEPFTETGFRLLSPVSFATAREEGPRRQHPWPDAVRVLTNLAERWDTFAGPVTLPPDIRKVIAAHAEASGGQVRIVEHLVEPSQHRSPAGYRRGSIGTVQFRLAEPESLPDTVLRATHALSRFAEYAGFGDRTALGMGQVRLVPSG